jgi:hypothetical protein
MEDIMAGYEQHDALRAKVSQALTTIEEEARRGERERVLGLIEWLQPPDELVNYMEDNYYAGQRKVLSDLTELLKE